MLRGSLLALVMSAAGCSDAHVTAREDAGGADARVRDDGGATDGPGGPEDGGPGDGGPRDGGRPLPPAMPVAVMPPMGDPAMVGDWVAGADVAQLEAADPVRARPTAPDFGMCGTWVGGGADPCEPWPPSGRATCTGVEEHFPGDPGCRAVGTTCPTPGAWAVSGLPMTGVLYVRPGATAPFMGTEAAPYPTIAAALAALGTERVIALAGGTYTGHIDLPANVTLWGACPRDTVLEAPAAIVVATSLDTALRNLRIGPAATGVEVPVGAVTELHDVVVERFTGAGVRIAGGELTATDLVVRSSTGTAAAGIAVSAGLLELSRGVIRDIGGIEGIGLRAATDGWEATLTDVAFTEIDTGNAAVDVSDTGIFEADGLVVEDSASGVSSHHGSTAHLARVVFRRLANVALGTFSVVDTTLERALVQDIGASGISFHNRATVRDVIIRDIGPQGRAIGTWVSVTTLERIRAERIGGLCLDIWEGATVTATSLDFRQCGVSPSLTPGQQLTGAAVLVTDHAQLWLSASRIEEGRSVGVLIGGCIGGQCAATYPEDRAGLGTVATLTDVEVTGTRPSMDGAIPGYGVLVTGGATANLTRVSVTRNPAAQLAAGYDAFGLGVGEMGLMHPGYVTLTDVLLRDGLGTGPGIVAADGSTIDGSRVVVSGATARGIDARGATTVVDLANVIVGDTAGGTAPRAALVARDEGTLTLRQSWVRRAPEGAAVLSGGHLSLADSATAATGTGIRAEGGAMLQLERVVLADLGTMGLDVRGLGTSATLQDLAVDSLMSGGGLGLLLREGAGATGGRIRVAVNRPGVVLVEDRDTTLVASNVTARCAAGTGACAVLTALDGAQVTLDRVVIDGARGLGAGVQGIGSRISLTDVDVVAPAVVPCGTAMCATGLGAYDAGTLEVDRFAISGSAGAGAQLQGGSLTLQDGVISRAAVGAEIPPMSDEASILRNVLFEDCATEISHTTGLRPPFPDPAP